MSIQEEDLYKLTLDFNIFEYQRLCGHEFSVYKMDWIIRKIKDALETNKIIKEVRK